MSKKNDDVQQVDVLIDSGDVEVNVDATITLNEIIQAKVTEYKAMVRHEISVAEKDLSAARADVAAAEQAVDKALDDFSTGVCATAILPMLDGLMRALKVPAKKRKKIKSDFSVTSNLVSGNDLISVHTRNVELPSPAMKTKAPYRRVYDEGLDHVSDMVFPAQRYTFATPSDIQKLVQEARKAMERREKAETAVADAKIKLSPSEVEYVRDQVHAKLYARLYENSGGKGKKLIGILQDDIKQLGTS
jgi:hypothetical protein